MHIPFFDIRKQNQELESKLESAVLDVVRSGVFISGPQVEKFEKEFAKYLKVKEVVAVNSGTSALHLALLALGVKPGDEVIVPSFTFAATAEAVLYCGATPVFVDVCEDTFNLNPTLVDQAITPKTVGIIPVHLFGQMADMANLKKIADKHHLWIIEDACQAHGAKYKNRMAGTIGKIGVFSFYPTKNLGGLGEGGALATRDSRIADYLRKVRSHGSGIRYNHDFLGYNYRLNEIQAAALQVKLANLNKWNRKRRDIAKRYTAALINLPMGLPREVSSFGHVYHQYTIRMECREKLKGYLSKHGIDTEVYYPKPLHQQEAFKNLSKVCGQLKVTERLTQEVLSLPIYPELTLSEVDYVILVIKAFFQQ